LIEDLSGAALENFDVALELGPDAGEGRKRPVFGEREPNDVLFLGLRIGLRRVFSKAIEMDQAAVFRLQPSLASAGKTCCEC
jgi:hypothetical protein